MKKTISFVMAVAMTFTMMASAMAASPVDGFVDVPETHWAHDSILKASDNGWVQGDGKGSYDPSGQVTGAQWFKMVVAAFYGDEVTGEAKPYWYTPLHDRG